MRYTLLLLIAALAVFAACAQETQQTTEDIIPETTPEEEELPEPVETEPTEAQPTAQDVPRDERTVAQRVFGSEETPTQAVPAELESLRDRAEERAENGYTFTYASRIDGQPGQAVYEEMPVYVRGESLLVELSSVQQLPGTQDQANRLAIHEGEEYAWCTSCVDASPFPADQGLIDLPTPTVWLYVLEDIEVRGQQRLESRNVMRVQATVQGNPIELFIDEFSGFPLRVTWQGIEHRYQRLSFGVLEDRVAIP